MPFIFDLLAQVSLNIMDPGFGGRTRIYEEYMMISNKQNLKSNLDKKAFLV